MSCQGTNHFDDDTNAISDLEKLRRMCIPHAVVAAAAAIVAACTLLYTAADCCSCCCCCCGAEAPARAPPPLQCYRMCTHSFDILCSDCLRHTESYDKDHDYHTLYSRAALPERMMQRSVTSCTLNPKCIPGTRELTFDVGDYAHNYQWAIPPSLHDMFVWLTFSGFQV